METVLPSNFASSKHWVLIVDDEETIRDTLQAFLSGAGFNVALAHDSQTALSIAETQTIDVAVIDRMLPRGMDGIEVVRRIKGLQPYCETILISGNPSFESAAQILQHDPFAYLAKPIRKDEICGAVQAAARKNVARKENDAHTAIWESIFYRSPQPILIYDTEMHVNFCNPSFTKKFGYDNREIIDAPLLFVPDLDAETVHAEFKAALNGEEVEEREQTMVCKSGELRDTTRLISLCQNNAGAPVGVLVIIRDITEEMKMEAALLHSETLANLGQLAAQYAHEINNPLQVVTGYSQLLLQSDLLCANAAKMVENIYEAGCSISKLTGDLMDVARPKPLKLTEFPPESPAEKAALFLKKTGLMKYCTIIRDYQADSPLITSDHDLLQEVFLNLIINAAHAMKESKTKILTLSTAYDSARNSIGIAVSDTGCGILQENLDKIFEPFFTTRLESGGTGLGLHVVKSIVERHGGSIEVASRINEGATFTITLPAVQNES